MPLTDAQVRKAKVTGSAYKLPDGSGLHLYVSAAGGKFWRFRYEFAGKEKLLSLGAYPEMSISEARSARDAAKAAIKAGRDPSVLKKANRLTAAATAGTTFEDVARQWHGKQKILWTERHADDVMRSLTKDVFPAIGAMPMAEITPQVVLGALQDMEARGARESAHRARQRISAIFKYAMAHSLAATDPAAIVQGALAPVKKGKQPAVTGLDEARELLRKGEAVPAHPVTKLALRVLALTSLRPGELRGARWEEFENLQGPCPIWHVPSDRMKMKIAHDVPLSTQAVEALLALYRLTGRGPLTFPMIRHAHRPISENAIGYLLHRAGYHQRHVPHGWRATFSTIMNERYRVDRHVIDLMLAHAPKDEVEAAYNRALHMDRRRELAQIWADLLMVDQQTPDEILGGAFR